VLVLERDVDVSGGAAQVCEHDGEFRLQTEMWIMEATLFCT
jgi:hypothetical protein